MIRKRAERRHAMFRGRELILLLISTMVQVMSRDVDYCYASNKNPYLKFGTRTAYHFVHGGRNHPQIIPHCRPVQIWMLIRHGTRYPGANTIGRMNDLEKFRNEIIENHESQLNFVHQIDGHLCEADLENLEAWRLDSEIQLENAVKLSKQGIEDLNQLGRRTKSNFPELFPPVISNVSSANYKFRSADEERMTSSKIAFMKGILDRDDIPDADIPANDSLFASYKRCPRWVTEVADNPKVSIELIKFREGSEYKNMISNVSWRLGFPNNITADSVSLMWEMCRNQKSLKVADLSPWCAVFSEEELKVLEYEEDLMDYYSRGPSHEYNIRLGCPPMQHLFKYFQKLESANYSREPEGVFNIGRSGSLHTFMAAMGFANDSTPPLASGFRSMNQRLWRTSEIGSLAANIAAVFYKCNDTGSPNKVAFYLAEKLVLYEGCNAGVCDWEYLKNKFPNATADCNSDFCYSDSSVTHPTST